MVNGIAPGQESPTLEVEPPVSPGPMSRPALLGRWMVRSVWRLAVLVAGTGLIGAGLALLVLPGPGIVVILLGLFVLASQFAWAELALHSLARRSASAAAKATASRNGRLLLCLSAAALVIGGGFVALVDGGSMLVGVSLVGAGVIGLITALIELPAHLIGAENQTEEDPK